MVSDVTWMKNHLKGPIISCMMTSSNGNFLRVVGPLWEESPVTSGFRLQRPVTRSFDVFFDLRLNKRYICHFNLGLFVSVALWNFSDPPPGVSIKNRITYNELYIFFLTAKFGLVSGCRKKNSWSLNLQESEITYLKTRIALLKSGWKWTLTCFFSHKNQELDEK